jgi:hypothetical protein
MMTPPPPPREPKVAKDARPRKPADD